jgi:hypothetical protein
VKGNFAMPIDHIPTETLFERARLKTALSGDAQSHLAACDLCKDQLSWMEVATDLELQDPPESAMEKVLQLGRNNSRLLKFRKVISALLTFDSFNLAPVGVRAETTTTSRQMTFEADGVEIGLWLRPAANQKMTLSGQVTGESSGPIQDSSAHADLVMDGDHIQSTPLSTWGEFSFSELPAGPCSLQVYFRDRVLRISPIPVMDDPEPR